MALKAKRSRNGQDCKLESTFKDLKHENFPIKKLEEVLEKAVKNQRSITDFFSCKSSVGEAASVATEDEVFLENPFFEPDIAVVEELSEEEEEYLITPPTCFKSLVKILKLPAPHKIKKKVKEVEEICTRILPLISKFLELKSQTESKSKHQWTKSKVSQEIKDAFKDVDKVRELLLKLGRLQYELDCLDIDEIMEENLVNIKLHLQENESELSIAGMFVLAKLP